MKKIIFSLALLVLTISAEAHNNQSMCTMTSSKGSTIALPPLSSAIVKGDVETVKKFIEYGADVNESNEQGVTPLMFAARYNRVEIIQVLLKNGANKEAKDNQGITALKYAERSQAKEAVTILQKK